MIIARTELKYIIPVKIYPELRRALSPFIRRDPFHKEGKMTYDVHSIYYDTPSFLYYRQKTEGEDEREKFRIRFYQDGELPPETPMFLELKQKRGPFIKKLRYPVPLKDLKATLQSGHIPDAAEKILNSYHLLNLVPMARTSYKREALIGLYEKDTRITFDTEILGSYASKFDTRVITKQSYLLSPLYYILEIKTPDSIPTWLSHIIERFDLDLTSFSKYTKAMDNAGVIQRLRGINYV